MGKAHILGFPRIGAARELKFAQEAFWRGEISETALLEVGAELRAAHWRLQQEAGLDLVTVGDFSWYDQVLSTLALLGAVPQRFGFDAQKLSLSDYFTAARGDAQHVAMEMTKWFDTNYHYLVPEWTDQTEFNGGSTHLFEEVEQARQLGHRVKVSLIGPLSLLYLGKIKSGLASPLELLHRLMPAYQTVLARLQQQGVEWVQIEEPILALDLPQEYLRAFLPAYQALRPTSPKLLLTTYFGSVAEHADLIHSLPVDGVHIDAVRAPEQVDTLLQDWPQHRVLSLGVIDGRNIWRADLSTIVQACQQHLQSNTNAEVWIGSSCSLLHVPVDLDSEKNMDAELRSWLAFATQKLAEIVCIKHALNSGYEVEVSTQLTEANAAIASRRTSSRIHIDSVKRRVAQVKREDGLRSSEFAVRAAVQQAHLNLPLFPTTSIGSFPQTAAIRQARAAYKRGELRHLDYLDAMRAEIAHVVEQQEKIGLDVLVHGEAERNDMVEYFGEQLWGYAFTGFGWVQSYGSRCVKPPIIYGDVFRPEAMTVSWTSYAQSLTKKPMKGMLTGPATMLQWSFVRDDQPRATTALQIALALRDEVADLQAAGIRVIQIDEPALREGLPLKQSEWKEYLEHAVFAFQLCAAVARDETQIHTHMCYAEFNDILPWIAAMDADVISIETSRSGLDLLNGFSEFAYANHIGPGVYDIHSPRVASIAEMQHCVQQARQLIPDNRLWINPDCGLKTRAWPETIAALEKMVAVARLLRASVAEEECSSECC